jgi:hypothetical protein
LLATGWTRQKELVQAADELDRQHAENARLTAENEALKLQITSLRTPLTTDQKLRIALDCNMRVRTGSGAVKYATAIEAAHGIKP